MPFLCIASPPFEVVYILYNRDNDLSTVFVKFPLPFIFPSFLDIQIHLKPKKETLISHKNSFKTISEVIYNNFSLNIAKYVERMLTEKGFQLSKTKSKTIYREM